MRALTDVARLERFMEALARAADRPARVYLTGGATAVLLGWRESTLDADIKVIPDGDWLYRTLPELKERLQMNVEFAAPSDFVPELPGWESRSVFIARHGLLDFYHYDLYGQALSKIERGHERDQGDVAEMFGRGLVERTRLRELFEAVIPLLPRYPAIDPASLRRAVEEATRQA